MTAQYRGFRTPLGTVVQTRGRSGTWYKLHHVIQHSPTGLEWGYGGSGPMDLATSILLHWLGHRRISPDLMIHSVPVSVLCQRFKWDVVAKLQSDRWKLTDNQLSQWLANTGIIFPVCPEEDVRD